MDRVAECNRSEATRVSPEQQVPAPSAEGLPCFLIDRREIASADLADANPRIAAYQIVGSDGVAVDRLDYLLVRGHTLRVSTRSDGCC